MSIEPHQKNTSGIIRYTYWLTIASLWTLLICGLCAYAIIQSKRGITENALLEAKTNIDRDLAYRSWASGHGGVYVVPSEKTPPNPYLKVVNRDVVTTEGINLTLINPAYMTRQVHESASQLYGIKGHLTSLKPIRPENKPDKWEETALVEIEKGSKEVSVPAVEIDGKMYLRQIRGMVAEKSCLKCHASQGYSEGDIRGGISVSVPLDGYYAIYTADRNGTLLRYSTIWIIGICGILTLRSNLNRSATALQASERRFRMLIEQAPEGIVVFDATTNQFVDANAAMERLFGCDRNELLRGGLDRFYSKEQPDERPAQDSMREYIQRVLSGEGVKTEISIKSTDGRICLCELYLALLPSEQEKLIRGSFIDITERKLAEQELRHSHELMSYIIKHNTSALAVHDKEFKYLFVSERYLEEYKVKDREVIGKHHYDVFPDLPQKWRDVHLKALAGITSRAENDRYDREDGSVEWTTWECRPWYEASGEIGGFIIYTEVVTDRIKAEEQKLLLQQQLHQAQKMEAIGTLAGGIAHDFNNILAAIIGYTEIARDACVEGSAIAKNLGKVLDAGQRAADLVRQILAFSRQAETERISIQPAHIVKEAIKLLRPVLPTTIIIKEHLDAESNSILADPIQIHRIVVNLCTNAYHAMEQTGGRLDIELKDCELTADDLKQQQNVKPGSFVVLSVRDTGPGVSASIKDKIFDPYFTTKEVGKGSGMGLAIVHGIVNKAGGFITCTSEPGKGTDFQVYFPAHEQKVNSEHKPVENVPIGKERILFIDDENILVEMGTTMLEGLGYEVTGCADSTEALNLFHNDPERFDVIITDQTMPGMTGIDLARRILLIRPGIPVILCTGYSNLVDETLAKNYGVKAFAMKPVTKKEIAKILRNVLENRRWE